METAGESQIGDASLEGGICRGKTIVPCFFWALNDKDIIDNYLLCYVCVIL